MFDATYRSAETACKAAERSKKQHFIFDIYQHCVNTGRPRFLTQGNGRANTICIATESHL
jgi:hypothetical protein